MITAPATHDRSVRQPDRRPAAVALGALVLVTVLSGCSFLSRDVVLEPYAPSDGLGAELGDVVVRNLLVVSLGSGEPGVISGTLVSRAAGEVSVQVTLGDFQEVVVLEPGESVQLGNGTDDAQVAAIVDAVDPVVGDTIGVQVTSDTGGGVTLNVPIVEPTREYETITPTAEAAGGS